MSMQPGHRTGPEVVLHEERVEFGKDRDAVRAVVRRRITSQTQLLEVTVRREVLEVEYLPVAEVSDSGSAAERAPVVMVLSEEVPQVQLVTRPYERVTVDVQQLVEQTDVSARIAREQVEVTQE